MSMDNLETLAQKNPKTLITATLLVLVVSFLGGMFGSYSRTVHVDLGEDTGPIYSTPESDNIFSVATSSGDTYFLVHNNGNVGVNTLTPKTKLDIVGLMRASWAFVPKCTREIEGAFAYDPTTHHFLGCNGSEWRILDNS